MARQILVVCMMLLLGEVTEAQNARWCTTSSPENTKCVAMKQKFLSRNLLPEISCIVGTNAQDCMTMIRDNAADLVTLDGGDVYVAGRDYDMVPIMEEVYEEGKRGYYAIAVARANSPDININNLQGKKSCHTGIKKTAGWNVPIGFLLEKGLITPVDCQQDIKSAGQFFNASCVPGVLIDSYNPDSNNPPNLCQQCKAEGCTQRNSHEPYYNYGGAFRCLAEGAGDVAFIKPQAVLANTDNNNQDTWALNLASTDFVSLCQDGTRKPISEAASCNLAQVPPHAVMTGQDRTPVQIRAYKDLLTSAQAIFGDDGNQEGFQMFESTGESSDLLFKDSTIRLNKVNNQNYRQFLGEDYAGTIEGLSKCPASTLRWCVVSDEELSKCRAMSAAFKGEGLTPEISCFRDIDQAVCMKSVADDEADVVTLDGGDIYQGGRQYNLRPLLSEIYDGTMDATYYAVAVVKATSSFTINQLKGKKSCHTGIWKTSGWLVPVGFLIDRGDIDVETKACDVAGAVGDFFGGSCAPGSKNPAYDAYGTNPDSLCQLCSGSADNKCSRSSAEPYYGYNGAFRCLVENAGEVAFVKQVTVSDTLTGDFPWADSVTKSDFQLLCRDGGRAAIDDWANCNLAKVPSHAVVTSPAKTTTERTQIADLLLNAQKLFGHDSNNRNFKMFDSAAYSVGGSASNLLFKDSTTQLQAVNARDEYDEYLSEEYVKDLDAIYCKPASGGAAYLHAHVFLVSLLALLVAIMKAI